MTERVAAFKDRHYDPVLTVDVAAGYSEAEDGVILTICPDQAMADKSPKGSEDAPFLRTIGLSFDDAKALAKGLKKASKAKR